MKENHDKIELMRNKVVLKLIHFKINIMFDENCFKFFLKNKTVVKLNSNLKRICSGINFSGILLF